MTNNKKNNRGFTLIETIVYIALFGILLAGVFVAAYNIVESGGKNQVKLMIKEEGDFLMAKINWAISVTGMANVKSDKELQAGDLEFKFDDSKNILTLSRDGGSEIQLNNDSVEVTKVIFSQIYVENQNKGIKYDIDLKSKAPNGMDINSHFESITYTHK